MQALVTGATGFVGGSIVRALVAEGVAVRALARETSSHRLLQGLPVEIVTGDLEDRESLSAALRGCSVVFHAAALTAFWDRDPNRFYRVNVEGTRNLLAAAAGRVERVVHTSTWAIIGRNPDGTPATEETQPLPEDLRGHYRQSKYQAEQVVKLAAARGQDVVIVNPTVPVGWGDLKPTPSGRIVRDFLRGRMPAGIRASLNLIDVEDVAQGHIGAWRRGRGGERYILGHRNMTLSETLKLLAEITGRRRPRLELPNGIVLAGARLDALLEGRILRREPLIPLEGVLHARRPRAVDCAKSITELGLPQSSVQEALEKSVHWFTDNGYV